MFAIITKTVIHNTTLSKTKDTSGLNVSLLEIPNMAIMVAILSIFTFNIKDMEITLK